MVQCRGAARRYVEPGCSVALAGEEREEENGLAELEGQVRPGGGHLVGARGRAIGCGVAAKGS